MIGIKARSRFDGRRLRKKAKQGHIKGLGHAAAVIRLTAKRSIRKRKGPSPKGSPPHTETKRLLSSILYAVDKTHERAVIGPSRRIIGIAGAEHEHGGKWRRERFPKRAFMFPALEKTLPRLPRHWAGAIG
ncbi:MAG TPA: hypothetical protein EYP56_00555 [Planctomycetaceae bacterium]|nr:hypothetical protein [Planctomycetaceae bacterium]